MIKRLSIFPVLVKNEWLFRVSISDNAHIMIIAMNLVHQDIFMIRFFEEEANAVAWIEEAAEGKHLDPI
jgi:hypothetical protein